MTFFKQQGGKRIMHDEGTELEMVDTELRLYVQYLHDLVRLSEKMADVAALIGEDTYGISSPRIKSTEEAKYQTSPKVYTEDAVLSRMAKKDAHAESLAALRIETAMKRIFCLQIQERICAADLSQKEMKILYLRYFQGLSLRVIAKMTWSNRESTRINLMKVLERL